MGARFVSAGQPEAAPTPAAVPAMAASMSPRPLPLEIRGIHVTGALASLPGKFRSYVGYKRYGLNTIELDVKDEGGEIGFQPAIVPLATTVGATRPFYNPKALVALAHRNGDLHDRPRRLLPGSEARAEAVPISRSSGGTAASGRRAPGSAG